MYRNEGRLKILEWYHLVIICEIFVFVVINDAKLAEILVTTSAEMSSQLFTLTDYNCKIMR